MFHGKNGSDFKEMKKKRPCYFKQGNKQNLGEAGGGEQKREREFTGSILK